MRGNEDGRAVRLYAFRFVSLRFVSFRFVYVYVYKSHAEADPRGIEPYLAPEVAPYDRPDRTGGDPADRPLSLAAVPPLIFL